MRLAIGVEYAGTAYSGWQRQDSAPSVQGELERALGAVAAHPVEISCAGRTDGGVHALGQVAHFETAAVRPMRGWALGANTHLPPDVAVLWATEVADDFHARFSALARTYRYVILNRTTRPAVWRDRCCWWHPPLDAERMNEAAQAFVGKHDFSAFRAAECQSRAPVRRLDRIAVNRDGDRVVLEVTANAFLHHMVRNLVGTLLEVGEGTRPVDWPAAVLAGRDRRAAGPTAPAAGLYFLRVDYPARFGLPGLAAVAPVGADAAFPL
ncbi:MAG: tRNA pseudouridine(38-40) synthase TruA [Steroidobacteraceae bacterium]|nr:tRNA pseudouridine(38-40) synthase TruA [Steroidobacteraceae bacterium]